LYLTVRVLCLDQHMQA